MCAVTSCEREHPEEYPSQVELAKYRNRKTTLTQRSSEFFKNRLRVVLNILFQHAISEHTTLCGGDGMKSKKGLAILGVLTLLAALPLCGCWKKNENAQQQWSQALRQLGIVPVYPPREDVQVGDVYLYEYDPDSTAAMSAFAKGDTRLGIEPRWAFLEGSSKDAGGEYKNRPSWPATPKVALQLPKDNNGTILTQPTQSNLFEPPTASPDRLRLAQFPDFSYASFKGGKLNAAIPFEGITAVIDMVGTTAQQISIKVPSAESYAVSSGKLVPELFEKNNKDANADPKVCKDELKGWTALRKQKKNDILQFAPSCNSNVFLDDGYVEQLKFYRSEFVWLRVISEVFYARAIDIYVTTNKAGEISASSSGGTGTISFDQQMCSPDKQKSTVQGLNEAMSHAGAAMPSGSLRIMGCANGSISMRRVFERPIAIGFRGNTLMVHTRSGIVVSAKVTAGSMSSAM